MQRRFIKIKHSFCRGVGDGSRRKDNWKPPKEYLKKHACKDKVCYIISAINANIFMHCLS